ncbi:hypothetical protein WR25_17379 [Diploscapter pachys]|uniref:Uncharacterized protein n=1 Tax=Diploscapter pachys TaxID=2018661 RepID=A0A2A2JDU2_9BILA|nr:hypothetical protein WR25_17379 [Diploscapter pachys]
MKFVELFHFLTLFAIIEFVQSQDKANNSKRKLIFSQLIFRHGARAPQSYISNRMYKNYFKRGAGELTDKGIEESYQLGLYLSKRYVQTGFLNPILVPKEIYAYGINENRCLMTGNLVGAGLFHNKSANSIPIAVPMRTEFTEKMMRHQLFIGELYDPKMIRIKVGYLLYTMLHDLQEKWNCYKGKCFSRSKNGSKSLAPCPREFCPNFNNIKLIYYSSQDWIIHLLLESIGIVNVTVGYDSFPQYNAALALEIYDNDGVPEVEIYYKAGAKSEMINYTKYAKGCNGTSAAERGACPLKAFLRCCDDLQEYYRGYTCHDAKTLTNRIPWTNPNNRRETTRQRRSLRSVGCES